MMFPKLLNGCGGISDTNNGAVKNNLYLLQIFVFRCLKRRCCTL